MVAVEHDPGHRVVVGITRCRAPDLDTTASEHVVCDDYIFHPVAGKFPPIFTDADDLDSHRCDVNLVVCDHYIPNGVVIATFPVCRVEQYSVLADLISPDHHIADRVTRRSTLKTTRGSDSNPTGDGI